ncbi:ead/Ea22-like family protein [Pseudomonas putida]|nr:ead/Ea22-like family protein [Pseudomonas putida]
MTIGKDQLKTTAQAASQGQWAQDGFEVHNDDVEDYLVAKCRSLADAAFIAAASPASILDLLDENEALRKDAERYRWLRDGAGYCDTRDIPGMAPARMDAFIDAAMAKGRAQ